MRAYNQYTRYVDMYTDVYADVLFLINFAMDTIALYVSARLCALRVRAVRVAVAAAIGALYSVISLFFDLNSVIEIGIFVLVCVIMICVAFKPERITETLKYSGVMFVSSSLLGGIMSASYSAVSVFFSKYMNMPDDQFMSPLAFCLLACFSMGAALVLTRLHGAGNMPKRAGVCIVLFDREITSEGIVDSGNLLTDPLSGKAVIVMRAELFRGILTEQFIMGAVQCDIETPYLLTGKERARFRLIPAKGVGKDLYLYGINPDKIYINVAKKKKTVRVERDAVIALTEQLGPNIDCIIPSSLI